MATYLVITANSKETAEELKTTVSQFLQSRGLVLSEEKTAITHIDKGFDFLGWTFNKYSGKLIVKPSKSSIKNIIRICSTIILKDGKVSTQSDLIRSLNQVIKGWTNYHKHVVTSKAFSNINNTLYHLLQQWAKHRHPNKNKWWRLNKYWNEKG
ncbi:group II intron maturase-specific domain-containing protein [Clostridium sp. DL-VIII]|uniref:group II intron maturase-specific domain-containing protein n=1 Tax=Clostridium sp. DL-VIII TaxID=641107 RepID=UPI000314FDB2|nr:group II intron maturase-specific domain-containing protein [Clostridium sp. DL-VIII]